MAVKNFFSGVEGQRHFSAAMAAGAKHMLVSYLYVAKQPGLLAARRAQYPDLKVMLDSGAHTLQTSMGKAPYNTWKLKDFENYVQGYAKFLNQNRANVFAAVELDVAYSLNLATGRGANDPYGDSVVDSWRRNIFMPLQKSGMNIIYVWHPSQGQTGWEEMCANYPYVGLPGEMSKNDDFSVYMGVAKRYLTKVHGFAATKMTDFRDWPWFSIDSITWKAGEIYGTLPVWLEASQRLKFVSKGEREPYRNIFVNQGLDADKIINDTDYGEVTRSSLKSMTAMEEFFKDRYKKRIFYYELRLPTPGRVLNQWTRERCKIIWKKLFRPSECFPQHTAPVSLELVRKWLHALACAQYRELNMLTPEGKKFLEHYFPAPMSATPIDTIGLAKEVAIRVSPGNETALRRETEDDFANNSNAARPRAEMLAVETDEIPEHMLEQLSNFARIEEAELAALMRGPETLSLPESD